MPSRPRAETVQLDQVGVYHCWNRCVRRAFLCGVDPVTGRDYEYRRDWICGMQENLAALFAIEIGFRSELSNHLHVILRTRPDIAQTWSDKDVVRRWLVVSKLAKSKDGQIREPCRARIAMEMAIPGRVDVLRSASRILLGSWGSCANTSHDEATGKTAVAVLFGKIATSAGRSLTRRRSSSVAFMWTLIRFALARRKHRKHRPIHPLTIVSARGRHVCRQQVRHRPTRTAASKPPMVGSAT